MKNNRVQIEKFTDDKSVQYDYKVLIYGNYTYRKNLEADSLVEVLRHVIPYMSKLQKIHFTIPIPEYVESLNFPNVEQIIYKQTNTSKEQNFTIYLQTKIKTSVFGTSCTDDSNACWV